MTSVTVHHSACHMRPPGLSMLQFSASKQLLDGRRDVLILEPESLLLCSAGQHPLPIEHHHCTLPQQSLRTPAGLSAWLSLPAPVHATDLQGA